MVTTCKKEPRELNLNQLNGKIAYQTLTGTSSAFELILPGLTVKELPSPHGAYRWSHDGKLLAMLDNWGNIFILDALNFDTIKRITPPDAPQGFAWSPDDSEIAIGVFSADHIKIYQLTGQPSLAREIKIGMGDLFNNSLDWSTDGNKFAFCTNDSLNNFYLGLIDANDGTYKRLAMDTYAFSDARISPDGKTIAYSSLLDHIKLLDLNAPVGTEPEVILYQSLHPVWSSDGKYLMYNYIVSVGWTSSNVDIRVKELSGNTKETTIKDNAGLIDWNSE